VHFAADIVLPHWFDDVVNLGVRGLPTVKHEWPEPKYLRRRMVWVRVGRRGARKKSVDQRDEEVVPEC
jgi:hypothetical protein